MLAYVGLDLCTFGVSTDVAYNFDGDYIRLRSFFFIFFTLVMVAMMVGGVAMMGFITRR
jgi:hypothetical protein